MLHSGKSEGSIYQRSGRLIGPQNIDVLERIAGVPDEKIIEAHGSFAGQHCIECDAAYPDEKIKVKIEKQEIPICERKGCGGYVKPDIVFFGESVSFPSIFHFQGSLQSNRDIHS